VAIDEHKKIHVYNGLTRELEYEMELHAVPMSVSISQDSKHLLVNKNDGEAQLINLVTRKLVHKFLGHTGGECLIRANFGGANESFVVSGSEGMSGCSFASVFRFRAEGSNQNILL
jgi:WD40 repeat protein